MGFTKATIEFCGKPRKFKRCANKTLIEFQKEIETIQKTMEPLFEESLEIEEEITDIDDQIERIEKRVAFIESAEEPTDDERRQAIKLLDKIDTLSKKKKQLRKQLRDEEKSKEAEMKQLKEDVDNKYADLACLLLDPMTPEEFIEQSDSIDMIKIQNLGVFYNMCQSGFNQKKIDKKVRSVIEASMAISEDFRQYNIQKARR